MQRKGSTEEQIDQEAHKSCDKWSQGRLFAYITLCKSYPFP